MTMAKRNMKTLKRKRKRKKKKRMDRRRELVSQSIELKRQLLLAFRL